LGHSSVSSKQNFFTAIAQRGITKYFWNGWEKQSNLEQSPPKEAFFFFCTLGKQKVNRDRGLSIRPKVKNDEAGHQTARK